MTTWIDDAEFAARFRTRAVTAERLQDALAGLTWTPLQFGPLRLGPIQLAVSCAIGLGDVTATDDGSFDVELPASADFTVWLGLRTQLAADLVIRLNARPRYAEPLLMVIDIAPIRAGDVTIRTRSAGLPGLAVLGLLEPALDELSPIIAGHVDALLNSEPLRSRRVVDVGARLEPEAPAAGEPPGEWCWLSDEQFGHRFLRRAVTMARVSAGFGRLAGTPVQFGPNTVGPGGITSVQAGGAVADPALTQRPGEGNPAFDATIPIRLDLSVTAVSRNDYAVDVEVPLTATARYADPLAVVLDIPNVPARAIGIRVRAASAGGRVFGRLARLDRQLRRRLAQEVNRRLAEASGTTVDIGAKIDSA